jgi:hypothetical protein
MAGTSPAMTPEKWCNMIGTRSTELGSRWQEGTRRFYTYVPETIGVGWVGTAGVPPALS